MKTNTNEKLDQVQIVMRLVRACGPVTIGQIEGELLEQCCFTSTAQDATRQAALVVSHGVQSGWLVEDDGGFEMAAN